MILFRIFGESSTLMEGVCNVRASGLLKEIQFTNDNSVMPIFSMHLAILIAIERFRYQCWSVHVLGIFQACVGENL